jgi:zinc protease
MERSHGRIDRRAGIVVIVLLALLSPSRATAAPLAERHVLDNGLTVLVASRRALPIVTVNATVRGGSLWEPAERPGLAHLTASLLTRGTATRTAAEIDETVDFIGASLSAQAGRDFSELEVTVVKAHLAAGLEVLVEALRRPAFPQDEVVRKVQQIRAALRKRQENPGEVAREAFNALVFGDHPYGRSLEGTEASLSAVGREEIVRFYRERYTPDRAIITVVGDVEPEEIMRQVRSLLGDWAGGAPGADRAAEPAPPAESAVTRKIERGVSQATIVLGHQGVSRDDPDYYALTVMNYVLGGGGFSSRLVERIREAEGWAYDVSSSFSPGLSRGSFQVVLQTKNETVWAAVDAVVRELRRMVERGVTDQELADAKAYLTGSFPLRLDTNRKLAELISAVEFYGLGLDYADRYPALIDAVTTEDVLRVARAHIRLDRYVLVVVADHAKAAQPD